MADLHALNILDTPSEPAFDDIVLLAATVCATTIALISLVDRDRQWFKASIGFAPSETPIEQAVCAHAIRDRDITVIPDLRLDPRTCGNPLVTAPDAVRFYAGAPLLTSSGQAIGTVCVMDAEPRPGGLSEAQAAALRALARQAVAAIEARDSGAEQRLELRRLGELELAANARLRNSEREREMLADSDSRSRSAQEAGRIGTFELDPGSDVAKVSPQFCRLFGLPVRTTYPASELERLTLPDEDSPRSTGKTRRDGTAALDVEYRIRRADDGQVRWIARRADFVRDARGAVVRMFGTVHDVTERRLAGQRMEALLKLGDRLRDADTVEAIVGIAADALCETLQCTRCGYALIDLAAGTFRIARDAARGIASMAGTHAIAGLPASFARLAEGVPLVHDDIATIGPIAADPAYASWGIRAQVAVPLIERGRLVGSVFAHDIVPRRWTAGEVEFVQGVADRTHAAIVAARARAERRVLNRELGHRLKNVMAMIQALASQTLRGIPDRAPVEALERRLLALSTAHDVLLRERWSEARITALLRGGVAMLGQEERVAFSGPDLAISARAALGLSLLVHELLTNALKYGALSVEGGKVAVDWSADTAADGQFSLCWTERGGPPASEPERRSFGSRLISLGILGTGGTSLSYKPTGLEATFSASLASVRADWDGDGGASGNEARSRHPGG